MKFDAAAFRRLPAAEQIEQLRGIRAEREFRIERAGIDEQRRTAWMSIASEAPVERWWGVEVLEISEAAINAERLKVGAALLVNHDRNEHVGVIDGYEIAGGKLRVLARFGRGVRATEIWRDVLDGIRVSTSVGYEINELKLVRTEGDTNHYRAVRWTPFEASLASVPADAGVGVARGHHPKRNTMQDERNEYQPRGARRLAERQRIEQALAVVPREDVQAFRIHLQELGEGDDASESDVLRVLGDPALAYERWRIDAIRAIGDMWPKYPEVKQLAQRAELDSSSTVAGFRKGALNVLSTMHKSETHTGELGADVVPHYGEGARVSHGVPLQCFKGPNAEREAYTIGMHIRSMAGDAKAGSWVKREMTEGVYGSGGAWVPADMLANAVISNVDRFGVARRFAQLWPMESASLSVPTNLEGLTIAAVGEKVATPTSDLSTGQVGLTAKEFAGGVRISRSLLDDSPIAIADFCVGEFARAVAKMEDQAAFTADGTSTYGGMTGLLWRVENQSRYAGAKHEAVSPHDTFAEIDTADLTALMGKLPEYARKGARWYCSVSAKDAIFTRILAAAGGNNMQSLQGGAGEAFLGYPIAPSPVLPSDAAANYNGKPILAFGDLRLATAFGDRRSLDFTIDASRFVEYRQIYVQVVSRFDVVSHMQGASATVCGPMVVLFGKT